MRTVANMPNAATANLLASGLHALQASTIDKIITAIGRLCGCVCARTRVGVSPCKSLCELWVRALRKCMIASKKKRPKLSHLLSRQGGSHDGRTPRLGCTLGYEYTALAEMCIQTI